MMKEKNYMHHVQTILQITVVNQCVRIPANVQTNLATPLLCLFFFLAREQLSTSAGIYT
jgi:hypothetical protein